MNCNGEEKQWRCGKAGGVNLQRVGSIVREISDPCLSPSPIKVIVPVQKMLKPDKWQAIFDCDGKATGFQKVLKLIIIGGVDPSIRPEVWEFLLGCYSPSSTAEYRQQLRTARRERYLELLMQCQKMNASVGTGSLAYVVGSKVMDMRTSSTDDRKQEKVRSRKTSLDNNDNSEKYSNCSETYADRSYGCQSEQLSYSDDLVKVRSSHDVAHDSSCLALTSSPVSCHSHKPVREESRSEDTGESYIDFPPLPVTNLFERSKEDIEECDDNDNKQIADCFNEDKDIEMHSFQIKNNEELIIESNGSPAEKTSCFKKSEIDMPQPDGCERELQSNASSNKRDIVGKLKISDIPQTAMLETTTSEEVADNDNRVSEWLWTLHQIVVDVVRTDNHLDFYEDTRNLARMSDILAVYAWVDPATGYCQGMSDLLSPFVVLFEDNADAFWCFEMLLRRMRENFQMEGPTGVMKQLQALWHIIRLTDRGISAHLSHIGAESLHFAFRMLLVLFRRELSFDEALCMWEMMWAADFDESIAYNLEESCLEALMLQVPRVSGAETCGDMIEDTNSVSKRRNSDCSFAPDCTINLVSRQPFCGLTRNFQLNKDRMQMSNSDLLTKNLVDELPVFCVAAILIINRDKIIRQTHSIDDMIKVFNDNMLKINVKKCVHTAIKLRKKYFYKLIKSNNLANQESEA